MKKKKKKLYLEDEDWIHVRQEFSQFVQNLPKQLCEERFVHSLTKKEVVKKKKNKNKINTTNKK